jgi:serine/threonine protein kinase
MVAVDAKQSSGSGTSDPLVGKVVHERFRIIAPIARGGMGAVYKAEQAPLGRLVALKVLSPKHEEDQDPEFRKRFFLEAATVAKLTHPNTVTVFDYGQSEGIYFIVMELLEGETLKKVMKDEGPFPAERAMHVTKQICRSLREAHRLGIIHRDMKPGNVMLLSQGDEKDYVKVLDFGLVKDIESGEEEDLTQAGVFMGSPKYMSPEQIQGERVDGRSDIYSIGILLYEMLAGHPPFQREKQVQILMDHINTPVPLLVAPEGAPPIPDEVAQIVYKCLQKKREDRFADMDQVLMALKNVAGELSMHLPASGELSGEHHLGRTPISGVHQLGGDPMRTTSSGAIQIPAVTGMPSAPSHAEGAPSPLLLEPPAEEQRKAGPLLIAFAAIFAVALAGALIMFLLDPFTPEVEQTVERPTVPELPDDEEPGVAPEIAGRPRDEVGSNVPEPQGDPAVIRSVLVELDSTPPGAMVRIGEQTYGPTPAQVELTGANAQAGSELTFVFTADDHREMTITRTVPSDGPLTVNARLRRNAVRAIAPRENTGGGREVTPTGYRDSPY